MASSHANNARGSATRSSDAWCVSAGQRVRIAHPQRAESRTGRLRRSFQRGRHALPRPDRSDRSFRPRMRTVHSGFVADYGVAMRDVATSRFTDLEADEPAAAIVRVAPGRHRARPHCPDRWRHRGSHDGSRGVPHASASGPAHLGTLAANRSPGGRFAHASRAARPVLVPRRLAANLRDRSAYVGPLELEVRAV